jgi:nucleoside triphosphatase
MQPMNASPLPFPTRVIVVPLIQNDRGQYLICRKPDRLGVFPGQWGLVGGGIEPGETMEQALRREIQEEVGLEVGEIKPLIFSDGKYPKYFADGSQQEIYMIFLVFSCLAASQVVQLNEEFEEFAWVDPPDLGKYDLNLRTVETFKYFGLM